MDFVTALAVANREFGQRESMRIHPLRDTHINDVPVIAAELIAEVCGKQNREMERVKAENERLREGLDRILRVYGNSHILPEDSVVRALIRAIRDLKA